MAAKMLKLVGLAWACVKKIKSLITVRTEKTTEPHTGELIQAEVAQFHLAAHERRSATNWLRDEIDLRNPCGEANESMRKLGNVFESDSGSGELESEFDSEFVDTVLPDMALAVQSARVQVQAVVNKILTSRTSLRRLVPGRELRDKHFAHVNHFANISATAPEREARNLQLILENLLKYIAYIRVLRHYELTWSDKRTRYPTFEMELRNLEHNQLKNLLCSVYSYAHAYSVTLPLGFITNEIESIEYIAPSSNNQGDIAEFVILNNFYKDFIPFAQKYFEHLVTV